MGNEGRPELPEGYRIVEAGKDWFYPQKRDRQRDSVWRYFEKGATSYYSYKTWQRAYQKIMADVKRRREQEA